MRRLPFLTRRRNGGERGIRTLGRALRPYGGLANRWFQPLTHLSVAYVATARSNSVQIVFQFGGGGGIRTHGAVTRTAVFKTATLNHSATPPGSRSTRRSRRSFQG